MKRVITGEPKFDELGHFDRAYFVWRENLTFWVYVLMSETTGRRYIGYTSDIERRLQEHNDKKTGKKRYTRKQPGPR